MAGHAADLLAAAAKPSLTLDEMGELHRAEAACTESQNASACRSWLQLLQKVCVPGAPHSTSGGDSAKAATGAGDAARGEQTAERPSDGWACFDLGQLHSLRLAEFNQPALAATYFRRACDQNHYRGCYNLAMMCAENMRQAAGIKSFPRAEESFVRSLPLTSGMCREAACRRISASRTGGRPARRIVASSVCAHVCTCQVQPRIGRPAPRRCEGNTAAGVLLRQASRQVVHPRSGSTYVRARFGVGFFVPAQINACMRANTHARSPACVR
jgi:hypothetical protein